MHFFVNALSFGMGIEQHVQMTFRKISSLKSSAFSFTKCYAKTCSNGEPGTTVLDHCRYAGAVAHALMRLLPECVRMRLPARADFCVALHDIGKVSPGFQGKYFKRSMSEYAPEWVLRCENGGVNQLHAEVGAAALRIIMGVEDENPVVQSVSAHHGVAPQSIHLNTDGEGWQSARIALVHELEKLFGETCTAFATCGSDVGLLAGLTCVADWLSSDEEFFDPAGKPYSEDELTEHVTQILNAAGFRRSSIRKGLSFKDVFGFEPRDEQRKLYDLVDGPGVYVMEASMGAGKTEAALYAAYKALASGQNQGIYFALPTRLTSDRIHQRVEAFMHVILETKDPVRLSHGQAWLREFEHGSEECGGRVPSWFSPSKRGLLYPFAVGTIDQALMAVMNVKHGFVRRFGLAGKVVILDEVHSYDLYTGTLLDMLVADLRKLGCTVIILSATLTESRRERLIGCGLPEANYYPCISAVNGTHTEGCFAAAVASRPPMEVALNWLEPGDSVAVDEALAQARRECNVLCIANTVKQAQMWYWQLTQSMTEDDKEIKTGLLHSRFPSFRREELEDDWMTALGKNPRSRPHGSILIATQIVEQSVDIDADYIISEIAPVDMLLQRMGRLWRHTRDVRPVSRPILAIALSAPHPESDEADSDAYRLCFGMGTSYVYAPYVLERTYAALRNRKSVNVPGSIRELLETVYAEEPDGANATIAEFKLEMQKRMDELRGHAIAASVGVRSLPCKSDDDENPPTRYGSRPTVKLLLVSEYDDGVGVACANILLLDGTNVRVNGYRRDFGVTRALYRNLVSVPVSQCPALRGRPTDTQLLEQHFHASEMPWVVKVDPKSGRLQIVATGEDSGLAYREDLGVYKPTAEAQAETTEKDIEDKMCPVDFTDERDW